MRSGDKSIFLSCVENKLKSTQKLFNSDDEMELEDEPKSIVAEETNQVDAIIFDGPAIVHMLDPKGCKNFEDYSALVEKYIVSNAKLYNAGRVDVVFHVYNDKSIKSHTREIRGSGGRRNVKKHVSLPKNWKSFLRNSENKT